MLERFKDIFSGLNTAYGVTTIIGDTRVKDGKKLTKNITVRQEPTSELYQKHLNGDNPALGIIPINEKNECRWGCVDIDQYDLNHKEILDKVKDLPVILCRSKSGGGHLFIFTKEWVPAVTMRDKLKMLAAYIGHANAEIIPKQDIKRSEKSVGSYLNLPYHGGDRTVRYAFNNEAQALTLQEFFKLYDEKALSLEGINGFSINMVAKADVDFFEGMPPCLKTLLSKGLGEGERNNTMFHLCVYLKKRYPKDWKGKAHIYNDKYFTPKLDADEVVTTCNSVEDKKYKYTCDAQPMKQYCHHSTCALQKFGVSSDELPAILPESIEVWESTPPIYIVHIDGDQVDCDDDTLWDPDKFGKACMNQTRKIVETPSKPLWKKLLKKLFLEHKISGVIAPESSKIDVQLKEFFEKFAIRAPGKDITDVRRTKPFTSEGKTIFRWIDFWNYMIRNGWDKKLNSYPKTQKMFVNLFKGKEISPKIEGVSTRVIEIPEVEIKKPIVRKTKKKDPSYK